MTRIMKHPGRWCRATLTTVLSHGFIVWLTFQPALPCHASIGLPASVNTLRTSGAGTPLRGVRGRKICGRKRCKPGSLVTHAIKQHRGNPCNLHRASGSVSAFPNHGDHVPCRLCFSLEMADSSMFSTTTRLPSGACCRSHLAHLMKIAARHRCADMDNDFMPRGSPHLNPHFFRNRHAHVFLNSSSVSSRLKISSVAALRGLCRHKRMYVSTIHEVGTAKPFWHCLLIASSTKLSSKKSSASRRSG